MKGCVQLRPDYDWKDLRLRWGSDPISIKKIYAHLYYISNIYTKLERNPLNTGGGVDYSNTLPETAKNEIK